jgi:hypothetical protein
VVHAVKTIQPFFTAEGGGIIAAGDLPGGDRIAWLTQRRIVAGGVVRHAAGSKKECPLAEFFGKGADRRAEVAAALEGDKGPIDAVDKDRYGWPNGQASEHDMQGLGKGMVDGHAVRNSRIKTLVRQELVQLSGDLSGDLQRAGKTADIAGCLGASADAEARHIFHEKPVEMIGAEGDHQVRIKGRYGFGPPAEGLLQQLPVLGFPGETIQ